MYYHYQKHPTYLIYIHYGKMYHQYCTIYTKHMSRAGVLACTRDDGRFRKWVTLLARVRHKASPPQIFWTQMTPLPRYCVRLKKTPQIFCTNMSR